MNHPFAYLSNGKLRFKLGTAPARTVESKFAETIRDRALKAQQRHAWKGQGAEGSPISGQVLWGNAFGKSGAVPISITSICRGKANGQLLYTLETESMCGVLALENFGEEERRLWSNNMKMLTRLSMNEKGDVACSIEHKTGTANIGVMPEEEEEDIGLCEVTEGDSLDTAPRWIPGKKRELVFQSAGIGRNQAGHMAGLSPFAIHHLNVESGEMSVLAVDSRSDLLTPFQTEEGTLYFIRRPYRENEKISPWRLIKDIVLMPFRLLLAVFSFLNVFSFLLTGKKLHTAGEGPKKEIDIKQMMIWGRVIQSQQGKNREEESPDLVPKSWELVQRNSEEKETVIARGVLAFDVANDGTIIYTNGSAIFSVSPGDKPQKIMEDKLISQIAWIEKPSA